MNDEEFVKALTETVIAQKEQIAELSSIFDDQLGMIKRLNDEKSVLVADVFKLRAAVASVSGVLAFEKLSFSASEFAKIIITAFADFGNAIDEEE